MFWVCNQFPFFTDRGLYFCSDFLILFIYLFLKRKFRWEYFESPTSVGSAEFIQAHVK